MVSTSTIWLLVHIFLITIVPGTLVLVTRDAPRGNEKVGTASAGLPDLIVESITTDDLDLGVVRVKIKNQGQRTALASRTQLTLTWGTTTKHFTNGAPSLQPGATFIVVFDVKLSLVQAKYCALVDAPNQVKEGDETNNKLCGQFEGKP